MSKIKKIVFSIITGIIAIFGIHSMSCAYYVGQIVGVTPSQYETSNNIFCVEHGQMIYSGTNKYTIISNVKIVGTKSTDHKGDTLDKKSNAKFAYILSGNNGSNKSNGPVSNAIWNYFGTWMKEVGQYHNGLSLSFTNFVKGNSSNSTTKLETEATEYANNIGNNTNATDNTNKNNIKVEAYNKDGKQYMRVGPFNWTFAGKLTEISVYDQNSKSISEKLYSTFTGNTEEWIGVGDIKSNSNFYISIPADSGVSKITKVAGKMSVNVKTANIWFLKSNLPSSNNVQNLIIREPAEVPENIDLTFDYDISILGNLKVIKVNKNNQELKLANVGFYIQNKNTGKYVKEASDGTISYVDTKEQAKEFITDKNGEITIKNLIVGTYVAYETKNPNYGYEIIKDGQEKNVVVDKTAELKIPNKQKYIKISGYVWVDKISGKQSYRNDLFKDNDYDSDDMLLDGIMVRLKDTSGNVVKETMTSNGGTYQFVDVLVDNLNKYYIEFEYDGLTYTNVVPHIDKDNGSKAAENATVRDNFNKNFSVIEGKTENTGITRDSNGNEKHNLTYTLNENEHTATLNNIGLYPITTNTDEAKYIIKEHFIDGQEEIKNINLGLYEREQPDLALLKDLENVRVSVNGYNHVYTAANRFNNQGTYEQGFNVGVKFGTGKEDEYGKIKYSAPVYKADYEYENKPDSSKELKVYATYRIRVKNESSNLQVSVNEIVDYYDVKYTITKVGTEIDEQGNVTGDISHRDTTDDEKYAKTTIKTNAKIDAQQYVDIYVQFELNREAVLNILNDGDNLNNVAEINSYSVFDEKENAYAGVDKDSNPGNAVPGDATTYQDDTDSAPGLKLEVAGEREMSGKVFLDSTSDKLMTGQVRQGSGKYEDGEKGISGVEVTLTETTGTGKSYKTKTLSASDINQSGLYGFIYNEETGMFEVEEYNREKASKYAYTNVKEEANGKPKPEPMLEEGDFLIKGFIPGDYTLTYTWGDKTYTVQNYKGTVYDSSRNQNDKNWYKENVDTRLTDAIDNYTTRLAIDSEEEISKMDSTTPIMGIGIEKDTDGNTRFGITQIETISDGDKFVTADFKIKNVDFGIVRRARQDLALEKRVASFKVALANGQVIADVTIDENGNMTGETNSVTYMRPSAATMPNNGYVKLELDSELIQGAIVEVGYEIKAINNSELDYLSEEFYKYGIIKGNLVTLTPSAIIDYLDKDWAFDAEKNTEWQVKTEDQIKDIVAETVYNNENSTISDKTILYTESLAEEKLEPTSSKAVMLNVSKVLANSDEISLDNEAEITKIEKTGGSETDSTPGNYIPGTGHTESDDSIAESVIVTPSTGDNLNFIVPIIVGVIALVILGAGVVVIKKKTL